MQIDPQIVTNRKKVIAEQIACHKYTSGIEKPNGLKLIAAWQMEAISPATLHNSPHSNSSDQT